MIKQIEDENLSSGKRYWKSLDDLAETPGFKTWVEREFPEGASMLEGVQRRGFMKLMAASFGLAGLGMTGCRRPEHTILPYGKSPEELIPRKLPLSLRNQEMPFVLGKGTLNTSSKYVRQILSLKPVEQSGHHLPC